MSISYSKSEGPEWPISFPTYEPTKYWLSGLVFEELPQLAQEYADALLPYVDASEGTELDYKKRSPKRVESSSKGLQSA